MKFLIKFRKTIMVIVKFFLIAALALGFTNVWYTSYGETMYSLAGNYVVIASYLLLTILFGGNLLCLIFP